MGLKPQGAAYLLKGGFFNRTIYIGAHTAEDAEFGSGGAYARIQAALANFEAVTSGAYRNAVALNWPTPTAMLSDPTYIGIYLAATGGSPIYTGALAVDVAAPDIGASFGILAGMLSINAAGAGITAAGSHEAMSQGLFSVGTNDRYITLHDGTPGTNGDNFIAGQRQAVDPAIFVHPTNMMNVMQNNAAINFGVQGSDLPEAMHMALRDGIGDSANVLFSDEIDNTQTDPELGDTFNIPIGGVRVTFTIDT